MQPVILSLDKQGFPSIPPAGQFYIQHRECKDAANSLDFGINVIEG
jgi:hypothetical protein